MTSLEQIQANRENSKLSTGPRTEEGKAASSRNHLTHGLCSVDPVLPTENHDEFKALLERCKSEWLPETEPAKIYVHAEAAAPFARLERHRATLERTCQRCVRALEIWQKDLKHIEAKFPNSLKKQAWCPTVPP